MQALRASLPGSLVSAHVIPLNTNTKDTNITLTLHMLLKIEHTVLGPGVVAC